MTREDLDFIGSMNMCDEISNEAYKKIMCHCEEQEPCNDAVSRQAVLDLVRGLKRWYVRSEDGKFNNVGLLYDDVMFGIDRLSSVTPAPKMSEIPTGSGSESSSEKPNKLEPKTDTWSIKDVAKVFEKYGLIVPEPYKESEGEE